MIYQEMNLIKAAMDENKIVYTINEIGEANVLSAPFSVKMGGRTEVLFIQPNEKGGIAARILDFISSVPEDKTDEIIQLANQCNREYKFVKFVVDGKGCVDVEYDFPDVSGKIGKSLGGEAVEIFFRFMQITNECYPRFMKALWN